MEQLLVFQQCLLYLAVVGESVAVLAAQTLGRLVARGIVVVPAQVLDDARGLACDAGAKSVFRWMPGHCGLRVISVLSEQFLGFLFHSWGNIATAE